MNFRIAVALLIGVVLGAFGLRTYFLFHAPVNDLKPVLQKLSDLGSKQDQQRADMLATNRELLLVKAAAMSGPDPARAKTAAAQAAAATAKDIGAPSPTPEEIVKGDAKTIASQEQAVKTEATNFGQAIASAPSIKTDKCQTIVKDFSGDSKGQPAKGDKSALADELGACQGQLDDESKRLHQEYKQMGCEQNPDTDACRAKHNEMKQADDLTKILKILITAVGIYFMVTGDVSTGLLLISMANGLGASDGGGGDGSGDAEKAGGNPQGQVSDQPTTSPAPAAADGKKANLIAGLGGTIACEPLGAGMRCTDTTKPTRTAVLDPSNSGRIDLDAPRAQAKASLEHAIQSNDQSIRRICTTDADGSAFMSGLIVKDSTGVFYLIRTTSDAGGGPLIVSYPPESSQAEPVCNIETSH